jgi:tripartite-type tricarboxylate transporter receptor subunit TctC
MKRRALLAACVAVLMVGTLPAQAQNRYPERPLRLVVPYAPGGVADITARMVTAKMSLAMGQQVMVENRPSAGGIVAAETVAKADPDGYTLLHMNSGYPISVSLFKSLPFDIVKDFAPVSRMGSFDVLIVTDTSSSLNNVRDLIAAANAEPGKFNIGSINVGSTQNLAAEYFKGVSGIQAPVIPFKGTPTMIAALKSKDIQAAFEIVAPVMALVKSGQLKALGSSGAERFPGLPNVPTVRESGFPSYQVTAWNAVVVPAKTPRDIVDRLNREMNAALALPEVRQRFQELGMNVHGGTTEELRELISSEITKWAKVVETAKIEKQ